MEISDLILWGTVALFLIAAWVWKQHVNLPGIGRQFYPIFGILVLVLLAGAQHWGWGYVDSDKIRDVPKTVRQNPGVYRAHYRSHGRTFGGK